MDLSSSCNFRLYKPYFSEFLDSSFNPDLVFMERTTLKKVLVFYPNALDFVAFVQDLLNK